MSITSYFSEIKDSNGDVKAIAAAKLKDKKGIDGIGFDGIGDIIHYAECSTSDGNAAKTANVTDANGNSYTFLLAKGSVVYVKFKSSNTASAPTLNINGTGAKPIKRYGTMDPLTTTDTAWIAGSVVCLVYDGTYWQMTGWLNSTYTNAKLGQGYGTCETAEATMEKEVTLSSYVQALGGIVVVKFANAVPANAMMNVNSKGAKAIYHKGAPITEGVINAGDTAVFVYSTYYHLISIDRNLADIATSGSYNDMKDTPAYHPGNNISIDEIDPNSEYQALESAYNSASTRIDTGVTTYNDDVEFYIRFKQTETGTMKLFGAATGSQLRYRLGFINSNSHNINLAYRSTSHLQSSITRTVNHVYTLKGMMKDGNAALYVKDETTGETDLKTGTYDVDTGYAPPICLFYMSTDNSYQVAGTHVYQAMLKVKGKTVLNYVPMKRKSDNAVGFIDTVSGSFITGTTGSFSAGEDSKAKAYVVSSDSEAPHKIEKLQNPTSRYRDSYRLTKGDAPITGSDVIDIPTEFTPLVSKEYQDNTFYCDGTANWENSTRLFMSVKPDADKEYWYVKYRVRVWVPNDADKRFTDSIVEYFGSGITMRAYKIWNTLSSVTTATYYQAAYWLTAAGLSNDFAHLLGTSILYASSYTNSAWYRYVKVDLLAYEGCDIELFDQLTKFTPYIQSIGASASTDYNSYSSYNATSLGLQETGDATDISIMQLSYTRFTAGAYGMMNRSLIMQDGQGKWQSFTINSGTAANKTKNPSGFKLGSNIYYLASTTDYASDAISGTSILRAFSYLVDFRYSLNITTTAGGANNLLPYKPLYIVGTLGNDKLFYLDNVWWTQDEPNTEDGKIYIKVSPAIYNDYTNDRCYRGDLHYNGDAYWYKEGRFRRYYDYYNPIETASIGPMGQYFGINLATNKQEHRQIYFTNINKAGVYLVTCDLGLLNKGEYDTNIDVGLYYGYTKVDENYLSDLLPRKLHHVFAPAGEPSSSFMIGVFALSQVEASNAIYVGFGFKSKEFLDIRGFYTTEADGIRESMIGIYRLGDVGQSNTITSSESLVEDRFIPT